MALFELKLLSSLYDVLFYELRSTRYMIVALLFILILFARTRYYCCFQLHCAVAYPLQVKMKVKLSIDFNLASFSSLFVSLLLSFFYRQFSIIVFLCSNVPSHHFLSFKERLIYHMFVQWGMRWRSCYYSSYLLKDCSCVWWQFFWFSFSLHVAFPVVLLRLFCSLVSKNCS